MLRVYLDDSFPGQKGEVEVGLMMTLCNPINRKGNGQINQLPETHSAVETIKRLGH